MPALQLHIQVFGKNQSLCDVENYSLIRGQKLDDAYVNNSLIKEDINVKNTLEILILILYAIINANE